MSDESEEAAVGWDVPGWDWAPSDYTWLSDKSGVYDRATDTHVFFIHGGRVRHQSHIPYGDYEIDEFHRLLLARAEGLDDPHLSWCEDTGGGDPGLWLEGTRPPRSDDLARLQSARERQERNDRYALSQLQLRHPDWFNPDSSPIEAPK